MDNSWVPSRVVHPRLIRFEGNNAHCVFEDEEIITITWDEVLRIGIWPFTRMPAFILIDEKTMIAVPPGADPARNSRDSFEWFEAKPKPGTRKWILEMQRADGTGGEIEIGPITAEDAEGVVKMYEAIAGPGGSVTLRDV